MLEHFIDLGRAANPGKTWDRIALEAAVAVISAMLLLYSVGFALWVLR